MEKSKFSLFRGLAQIEVWPSQNYQAYLPKGSMSLRINSYWINTGRYLKTAVSQYERTKVAEK
jgi:hypothetical protein